MKKFQPEEENWYVLCTKSRYEKKLSDNLKKAGIEHYLPTQIIRKKWSDRWKNVEMPLFPGYIFVQMDESNRFQILNTPGAVRFLYWNKDYARLSRRDIEMINIAVSDEQELEVVDTGLYEGQEVKIISGPFKSFHGKLVQHNGKGKLLIEVQSIAQGVLIEINNAKLVPKQGSTLMG